MWGWESGAERIGLGVWAGSVGWECGLGECVLKSGAGRVDLGECGWESGAGRVGLVEWGWKSGAGRVGLEEWGWEWGGW